VQSLSKALTLYDKTLVPLVPCWLESTEAPQRWVVERHTQ